jgi:hypothetical protein
MNLFKRIKLFLKRQPTSISAAKIVYPLPDATVYKKYYNQDELFHDVDWGNWNAVVEGFEARFVKWYFDHMPGGNASYIDFCALCALIEVFLHYESDKNWHDPKNYKEFLRKLDPVFRTELHSPISVTRWEGGAWRQGTLRDFADVFYTGVRCALHHHGDLASFAGMSGTGQLAIEHPDAGCSTCGAYKFSIIVFDPGELKVRLRQWLHSYCAELRRAPSSDKAIRFRDKFRNDFGINIQIPSEST